MEIPKETNKLVTNINAEETARGIRNIGEQRDIMEKNLGNLRDMHPNKWVAVSQGQILGPCESFEEIMKTLEEKGDIKSAIIEYLNPNPPTLIL